MIKNNLTAEWKNNNRITIEIFCPVCEQPKSYQVELPPDLIDDVLYTAFTDTVCPWVEKTEIFETECYGNCDSQQVTRGGSLIICNRYNQECRILDLENFLKGFYQAFARHLVMSLYIDREEDFLQLNSKTIDEIIQYALFNEVRYPHRVDDGGNNND